MATQDNNPGLLSKVARFVRNPTKDWAALDKPQEPQDMDHGKEALKLVIERKRHDDAVRRREFSQLRKLRQASPSIKAELAHGLSSFASTSGETDMDERATTLKKIDEIEAQMSRQWWKSRSGLAPAALTAPSDSAHTPVAKDAFPATQASRLSPDDTAENFDFQPTKPGGAALQSADDAFPVSTRSVLSPSFMTVVDQSAYLSDPDMEEAAIRFANSDDAGAEAALQAAWQLPDAKPELAQGWAAALFGLYRSTGQRDCFERLAMDYAQRFGRSAPAWSIAPQSMQANPPTLSPGETDQAVAAAGQHWVCPAAFDDLAVVQLRDLVGSNTVTYCLNWGQLQRMSASGAKRLAELLARWCGMPLTLAFEGVAPLLDLLQAYTPSGDRSVPAFFWQLRFDVLRLLRQQDDYELAALDYCVTFEVSPPPWYVPMGQRVDWPQDPASPFARDLGVTLPEEALAYALAPSLVPEPARQLALSGEVIGDVSGIVARWQLAAGDDGYWVVSCAQLIRVDFSAAGGLLNWAARMATEGKHVAFRDVPHLVAVFFNLIGINEHAQVTARIN